MNDNELNDLVEAWITAAEVAEGSPEDERNRLAADRVLDWMLDGEAELLWRFILTAYKHEMSPDAASLLAAGPLEDLLSKFGPTYIERVERLAEQDDRFNWLLGGVWRSEMTEEVWKRVQAVRREVW